MDAQKVRVRHLAFLFWSMLLLGRDFSRLWVYARIPCREVQEGNEKVLQWKREFGAPTGVLHRVGRLSAMGEIYNRGITKKHRFTGRKLIESPSYIACSRYSTS